MTGIVSCASCVFNGTAKDGITSVCRRTSPTVITPQGLSGEHNHIIAVWPAVDPDRDGCGAGVAKP